MDLLTTGKLIETIPKSDIPGFLVEIDALKTKVLGAA